MKTSTLITSLEKYTQSQVDCNFSINLEAAHKSRLQLEFSFHSHIAHTHTPIMWVEI